MGRDRLGDMHLTKKLLVSPFTVLLLLIVFSIVSYIGFSKQQSALEDIFKNRFKRSQTIASAIVELTRIHQKANEMYNSARESEEIAKREKQSKTKSEPIASTTTHSADATLQEGRKQLLLSFQQTAAALEEAANWSSATNEEKECFLQVKEQAARYMASLQSFVAKLNAGSASAASAESGRSETSYSALSLDFYRLLHLEEKLSEAQYVGAATTHRIAMTIMALILAVAVFLSIAVSMIMKTLILSPITMTVDAIEAVAEGDLTRRINVVSWDEIGEMAGHFNLFADKLHSAIAHVAESSNDVSSAAGALDSATEQMAAGVNEAAMQVDTVAAAIEEMSKTSSDIAQNCVAAVKSAELAGSSANTGESIIRETIAVMDRISSRVKGSAEIIGRLGARSDQIGEIVRLINDVADQTNLLALNAAIEAARAGEHGRGFAVVADEVRKLAERTGNATREITDTIHAMQAETKKAVSSMEAGVGEVGAGAAEAARSGEALKDILLHIDRVTGEINQIAVAAEEETTVANDIASGILQISAVMQDIGRMIQENSAASSRLAGLSKGLQTLVGQFRLSGE